MNRINWEYAESASAFPINSCVSVCFFTTLKSVRSIGTHNHSQSDLFEWWRKNAHHSKLSHSICSLENDSPVYLFLLLIQFPNTLQYRLIAVSQNSTEQNGKKSDRIEKRVETTANDNIWMRCYSFFSYLSINRMQLRRQQYN